MSKVLVGYDGTESGQDALALGRLLHGKQGSELLVACVYLFDENLSQTVSSALHEQAEQTLEGALQYLRDGGIDARGITYPAKSPARGLHELGESADASVLVVGSKERGRVGRLLPSAVGWRLMHGATVPVAIAPRGFAEHAPSSLSTVGVAFDGSEESRAAVDEAVRVGRHTGASLHLLSVAAAPPVPPPIQVQTAYDVEAAVVAQHRRAERQIEAMRDSLGSDIECTGEALVGDPSDSLSIAARSGDLDLLVSGSRGFGPVRRVVLGSVSSRLAETLPCPLMVVPRGE